MAKKIWCSLRMGWWLFPVFFLCVSPVVAGMELPEPPEGYSWKQIVKFKAAFLVPEAWEFDSEVSADQHLFTMTRKQQDDGQPGETSLTIVIRRAAGESDLPAILPSRFAAALFSEIRKYRELERAQSAPQGPFETIRYQYVSSSADSAQFREYSLLVANDQTGTLYVLTFRAPLASWEDDWQTVSVVLDTIFLDDEI